MFQKSKSMNHIRPDVINLYHQLFDDEPNEESTMILMSRCATQISKNESVHSCTIDDGGIHMNLTDGSAVFATFPIHVVSLFERLGL